MPELPPWRSPLARALQRNRALPHLKFVQLATVDAEGIPHNRTIVYRGLVDQTHQLKFVTDQRSEKIPQLRAQPTVELCWYFTKSREQFRFAGMMTVIDTSADLGALRLDAWARLSSKAQQQFYWPQPGATRSPDPDFEGIETAPNPPDSFVLLLLTPTEVEHLQLRGNPQNRDRYTLIDLDWQRESLNP